MSEIKQANWGRFKVQIKAPYCSDLILDTAKALIDQASPQRYGPAGTHWYSLRHREHLINLLLWEFHHKGYFPSGWACFVKDWHYEEIENNKGWSTFKHLRSDYHPGYWYEIPALEPELSELCHEKWKKL